ncbi:hypothetical protein HMI54_012644 [Coelomomyces lativittatus]|nr:hypothetical protein HMI54_012644 [Coelomomyces lativittatus]KAJ1515658.1 hypothetical protein HMI56_002671 [Coelomomyces lativittatus]KAJ1518087.1 hypothetical protein HMI55_003145 [Coelomomyces lativittatus]
MLIRTHLPFEFYRTPAYSILKITRFFNKPEDRSWTRFPILLARFRSSKNSNKATPTTHYFTSNANLKKKALSITIPFLPFLSDTGHYYAVRCGRHCGIFSNHQEFNLQVQKYSRSEGKRFSTYMQAYLYLYHSFIKKPAKRSASSISCVYPTSLLHLNAAIHPAPLPNHFLRVYTDGSYKEISKKAGIGVWIDDEHPCNLSAPFKPILSDDEPSSNRAEIQAVTRALTQLPRHLHLEIRTDSLHVIRGITAYFQHHASPGFFHSSSLHPDHLYFQELAKQIEGREGFVFFVHVKSHVGVDGNEKADLLARDGAEKN